MVWNSFKGGIYVKLSLLLYAVRFLPSLSLPSLPLLKRVRSRCREREKRKKKSRGLVVMLINGNVLGWMLLLGIVGMSGFMAAMTVDVRDRGGGRWPAGELRRQLGHHERLLLGVESIRASLSTAAASPGPSISSPRLGGSSRVYHVTDYGADPTGATDSTNAILRAIADVFRTSSDGNLMDGITNLGGAEIHLDGGEYLIKAPLTLPASGGGNLKIFGGSLRASDDFPTDRYLIELWASPNPSKDDSSFSNGDGSTKLSSNSHYDFEYTTIRDLMLDCNYRGGGIAIVNSLRTTVDNCYIVHFATEGISVREGHETYIHNSYLGQHITAGNDPDEKNFSGTAISLMGNDNAVTDVVIFSAAIGILITGQANALSGVHCYNKATGWGGSGIYIKSPGLTQTRILNCYLDYTNIVVEDPVQLVVSSSFFLGDANIVLKSVKGVVRGVDIVDNMFSGGDRGVEIVKLDESTTKFTTVNQVFVERNSVDGMSVRATVARGSIEGNGSSWAVDFSPVLLFPDRIEHVQYTMMATSGTFPNHTLRNVSGNRVVIESDVSVPARVDVAVHQCVGSVN